MMQTTKLILKHEERKEEVVDMSVIKDDNLDRVIFDLNINLPTRMCALDKFHTSKSFQESSEVISRLCNMFQFSGLKKLREYMYAICKTSRLHTLLKLQIAEFFCFNNEKDEIGFDLLNFLIPMIEFHSDISTVLHINYIFVLKNCKMYKTNTRNYLLDIINLKSLDSEYRYGILVKLQIKPETKEEDLFYCQELYPVFFFNPQNEIRYRILSGQYMLLNCGFDDENRDRIEKELINIGRDDKIEYNIRADAIDTVLQTAKDENKKSAEKLILELGGMNTSLVKTIYDNAQNVHSKEIDQSAKEIVEFFNTFKLIVVDNQPLTLNNISEKVFQLADENKETDRERLKVAFNRIRLDRMLYGSSSYTLTTILLKLWTFIQGHESRIELEKRLLQELQDMADTCSSGFCNRLVNVLSGFTEHGLRIGWRDQIKANVAGRLNAKIREMDDVSMQTLILSEMALSAEDYESRTHFLDFFKAHILTIRDEMYQEFKNHVDDNSFDFYFKLAISHYESGEKDLFEK